MIMRVAASNPRITSIVTDSCIVEGQNVTLTCEVMYNGTNLMPMKMSWTSWPPTTHYWIWHINYDDIIETLNVVNSSSVFQSSYTFRATGHATNDFECAVQFSAPTGLEFYVQRQYSAPPLSRFWSSPYASKTVASK